MVSQSELVPQGGKRSAMIRFALLLIVLATGISGSALSYPHDKITFADWVSGGGWSVQLAIYNLSNTAPLKGSLYVGSEQGSVDLFNLNSGTLPEFTIPPRGTIVYESSPSENLRRGYVVVMQDNDPGVFGGKMLDAVLTYRYRTGLEVTVPAFHNHDDPAYSGQASEATMFVEETDEIGTGVGIKKGPTTIVCLSLIDQEGNYLLDRDDYTSICYDRRWEHRAWTIPEWFEVFEPSGWRIPPGFKGTLKITTSEDTKRCCLQFVAVGLRFSKQSKPTLSSVPIYRNVP